MPIMVNSENPGKAKSCHNEYFGVVQPWQRGCPSMTELSAYVLEPIREGPDFTLYRGRQHGNPSRVLAVALAAEHPSPQGLRRLEHEYSLAAELDSAWAATPLALTRHEGRTILILMDPGGEPLDLGLQRDQLLY